MPAAQRVGRRRRLRDDENGSLNTTRRSTQPYALHRCPPSSWWMRARTSRSASLLRYQRSRSVPGSGSGPIAEGEQDQQERCRMQQAAMTKGTV